MRLALVIGEQRLALEQRMLNRLTVGLMAEGVQITRILPAGDQTSGLSEAEQRVALAPRVEVHMRPLPWMRRMYVRAAIENLEAAMPDVLYLLGRDAWNFGLELARELDRPAILEVWSASQVPSLPRPASSGLRSHVAAVTAPCVGLEQIVRRRVGAELSALIPMGVPASREPVTSQAIADSDRPPSVAVVGSARDVSAYAAMFTGLKRVLDAGQPLEIMLELRGVHEHEVWRAAERAGLINAVSAIGSASQHHSLLTACDLLLCPEHFGDLRSVVLESMAGAVPVISVQDPALDMLIDGETAMIVKEANARAWEQAVATLLTDAARRQSIGNAAREKILSQHRSSHQLHALLELLQRLVGTDAYAFPADG